MFRISTKTGANNETAGGAFAAKRVTPVGFTSAIEDHVGPLYFGLGECQEKASRTSTTGTNVGKNTHVLHKKAVDENTTVHCAILGKDYCITKTFQGKLHHIKTAAYARVQRVYAH